MRSKIDNLLKNGIGIKLDKINKIQMHIFS